MDREGRWLGWYRALERYYVNLAKDLESSPELADEMRARASQYGTYRSAIAEKLPHGHEIEPPPTMDRLLASLDALPLYRLYRITSQYQHGEPLALDSVLRVVDIPADPRETARVFRSGGRAVDLGPLAEEHDWLVPLSASANAVMICGQFVFTRTGAKAIDLDKLSARYRDTIDRLRAIGTQGAQG